MMSHWKYENETNNERVRTPQAFAFPLCTSFPCDCGSQTMKGKTTSCPFIKQTHTNKDSVYMRELFFTNLLLLLIIWLTIVCFIYKGFFLLSKGSYREHLLISSEGIFLLNWCFFYFFSSSNLQWCESELFFGEISWKNFLSKGRYYSNQPE